jgi:hypothetical protein
VTPKQIEWREGDYGTRYGYVGGLVLFTLTWVGDRDRQNPPYRLRTALPGFKKDMRVTDAGEADNLAQRILTWFLERISEDPA